MHRLLTNTIWIAADLHWYVQSSKVQNSNSWSIINSHKTQLYSNTNWLDRQWLGNYNFYQFIFLWCFPSFVFAICHVSMESTLSVWRRCPNLHRIYRISLKCLLICRRIVAFNPINDLNIVVTFFPTNLFVVQIIESKPKKVLWLKPCIIILGAKWWEISISPSTKRENNMRRGMRAYT